MESRVFLYNGPSWGRSDRYVLYAEDPSNWVRKGFTSKVVIVEPTFYVANAESSFESHTKRLEGISEHGITTCPSLCYMLFKYLRKAIVLPTSPLKHQVKLACNGKIK